MRHTLWKEFGVVGPELAVPGEPDRWARRQRGRKNPTGEKKGRVRGLWRKKGKKAVTSGWTECWRKAPSQAKAWEEDRVKPGAVLISEPEETAVKNKEGAARR